MRKILGWLVIVGILLIAVTLVRNIAHAQYTNTQHIVGVESQDRHAIPVMVFWHTDSLKVTSVGWVDIKGDSLLIIKDIADDGDARNFTAIPKSAVDSVSLLKPVQTAIFKKPPIGG
jgi:hypothetical protein